MSRITTLINAFQNQTLVRKLLIGCTTPLLLVCLCSMSILLIPTPPTTEPVAVRGNNLIQEQTPETIPITITAESSPTFPEETAVVTHIIDGDTIEVERDGRRYRVRYIGMDTPERGDDFFSEATEANRALVEDQTIIMVKDVSETDRYGRLLRYIYLPDGTFVNAELVRLGFAQPATFPPDVRHQALFSQLEQEARAAETGLWAPDPIAAISATPTSRPTNTATATPRPATNTPTATPLPPTATPLPPTATPLPPTATNVPTQPPTAIPPTQPPPTIAPTLPPPTSIPPTAPPPPAPGNVIITYIFFDGVVPRAESDEYAVITNQGGTAVNLAGWRLNAGDAGQDFYFPAVDLQPGQSCRIYTNELHPEFCGFNFGRGSAIWNNGGECGYLFDSNGSEVSTYCY